MTNPFASRITGTGSAFPETRISNHEMSKRVETSDEWIRERTGIVERRFSRTGYEPEQNSSLGTIAATRALEMAGKSAADIDLILYATCTPDTPLPSSACWIQKKLGAKNAWAVDLNAACSGFVYALTMADQFLKAGTHKTALVVGAEVLTSITNFKDRSSCILFGDGAGAVVVERVAADEPRRILWSHLGSDGNYWDFFHVPVGGSNEEITPQAHERGADKMHMKGQEMYKFAVKTLSSHATQALEANGLGIQDLHWFVPHQANLRILEGVAKRLSLPMEKVIVNLDRYGNTSSATVPTALDEGVRDGRIQPGQTVLLDAFGAGLTWGSILLRW